MRLNPAFALLSLLVVATAAAQTSPTLEERMSQADFHGTGLDRLSPTELAHLNAWLEAHGEGQVKYIGNNGKPAFYPDSSARDTIEDRIAGDFTGWLGGTVFTLDNGQQWKQAESGRFSTRAISNPKVKIKPMLLGSWLMYIDGCGCDLRVERVR